MTKPENNKVHSSSGPHTNTHKHTRTSMGNPHHHLNILLSAMRGNTLPLSSSPAFCYQYEPRTSYAYLPGSAKQVPASTCSLYFCHVTLTQPPPHSHTQTWAPANLSLPWLLLPAFLPPLRPPAPWPRTPLRGISIPLCSSEGRSAWG